jgi:hypothetical protein
LTIVLFDTPTPTPSPTPTYLPTPAGGNAPVSSFHVDTNARPPWDVPMLPTWGTGTPDATLYAATPGHGTDYPNQAGTATAQIGAFVEPISGLSTPIAGMVAAGPTTTAGDINTGLDPIGAGDISISDFGSQMHDGVVTLVTYAKEWITHLVDLGTYSPWLSPIPAMLILTTVLGLFLGMIALVIKGGSWLLNLLIKVFTFIGVWKP